MFVIAMKSTMAEDRQGIWRTELRDSNLKSERWENKTRIGIVHFKRKETVTNGKGQKRASD